MIVRLTFSVKPVHVDSSAMPMYHALSIRNVTRLTPYVRRSHAPLKANVKLNYAVDKMNSVLQKFRLMVVLAFFVEEAIFQMMIVLMLMVALIRDGGVPKILESAMNRIVLANMDPIKTALTRITFHIYATEVFAR